MTKSIKDEVYFVAWPTLTMTTIPVNVKVKGLGHYFKIKEQARIYQLFQLIKRHNDSDVDSKLNEIQLEVLQRELTSLVDEFPEYAI